MYQGYSGSHGVVKKGNCGGLRFGFRYIVRKLYIGFSASLVR